MRGRRREGEGQGQLVGANGVEFVTLRLFAITDASVTDAATTVARAKALLDVIDPRMVAFGVRDHESPVSSRVALARALVAVAHPRGAKVMVHDRVDVARVAGADGAHLAERSIDAASARGLLGTSAWIGRSCHDEAGLQSALAEGVDAVTLSPVFASPGKGAPLGLERFARLRGSVAGLDVFALGGIDPSNAESVLSAGASGLAMIRAWLTGSLAAWAPVFARLSMPSVR